MNIQKLAKKADDEADRLINMPGEYHPDWHDVRDSIFAALVLEEAAVECDKRAHAGDAGALMAARAIRALKGAKE